MNLSILIEESSRDRSIKISLAEARALYLELGILLMDTVDKHKSFNTGSFTPLGGSGYEAPDPDPNARIHYWDCGMDTDHKGECINRLGGVPANDEAREILGEGSAFNAEVKDRLTEESPETLREPRCVTGCWCNNCYSAHFTSKANANGICNDPTIPVDKW